MIDAGDTLRSALQPVFHAKSIQQILRAGLYTMAKPNRFYFGIALHIAAEHSHWIGIV